MALGIFRELIQNSFDASASWINFAIQDSPDGDSVAVSANDNGSGMSRDVLENKLLSLGGSHKEGSSVGGFGYAKTIILFAHLKYEIRTGSLLVIGSGGDYSIRESESPVKGTHIRVWLYREGSWNADRLSQVVTDYASYITVSRSFSVFLNNRKLNSQFTDFKFLNKTTLGSVLFNEVESSNHTLIVSMRGLPMYVHRSYAGNGVAYQGVLELAGDSLSMLTANRDGLRSQYWSELDRVLQQMADNRSALKQGKIVKLRMNRLAQQLVAVEQSGLSVGAGPTRSLDSSNLTGIDKLELELPDVVNDYYPSNFDLRIQTKAEFSTSEIVKLVKTKWMKDLSWAWKLAVYSVLRSSAGSSLINLTWAPVNPHIEESEIDFSSVKDLVDKVQWFYNEKLVVIGFVISEDLEGLCVNSSNEITILVNPRFFDPASFGNADLNCKMIELMDVAWHEVSHINNGAHNEAFVLTELKTRRAWRRMFNFEFVELITGVAGRHASASANRRNSKSRNTVNKSTDDKQKVVSTDPRSNEVSPKAKSAKAETVKIKRSPKRKTRS